MDAKIGTQLARCALTVAALMVATAAAPAGALAGGPGVTVFTRESPQPLTLSGDQIALSGDVRGRTYTVRRSPGGGGTRLLLTGLSIRALLQRAGVDPDRIRFVSVVRGNGSLAVLRRADIRNPPPFAEGPALVADDGTSTHFLRPVRGRRGTNATDHVVSSDAGPLEITVDGGSLLAVKAQASRRRVDTGRPVTFSARVQFPPRGARITYHWDFGDGTTATGQRVTHSFSLDAEQQVQVSARAVGGSGNCAVICGGVDTIAVRVGDPRRGPQAPGGSAGGGAGNPQAPGSGTGTGAGGVGGTGGGTTPGATGEAEVQAVLRDLQRQRRRQRDREQAAVRRRREAARRRARAERELRRVPPPEVTRPSDPTVTGVLLAGQGTTVTGRLPPARPQPAGSPKEMQAARGARQDDGTPVSAAAGVALLVMWMGALQERRRVRLRIA